MIYSRMCASAVVYRTSAVNGHTTYLLTTRKNKDVREGKCILPKGGIDPGSSPMSAAVIEVMEETGTVCSAQGVLLGSYSKYNEKEGIVNNIDVFGLEYIGLAKDQPTENRHVIWCDYDEALALIDPYLAPFIIRMNHHLEATFIHEAHKKGRNQ